MLSLFVVFVSVLAVFCYYKVTDILLIVCCVPILCTFRALKKVFKHKNSYFAFAFLILTVITALYYKNTKGLSLSFTFIAVAIIGFYLRSVMTKELFEWTLNLILCACIAVFIGCIIVKFPLINDPYYRCALWFRNSNYLSSIMAGCILICAYKTIIGKEKNPIVYLIALGCAICIYFCGSMFAILEVLTGITVLLSLNKKHRLLRMFLFICAIGCFSVIFVPDIFPRLTESGSTTDSRILIWQDTIKHIPDSFWFGKGFFTYRTLTDVRFLSSHAHNFLLESLLSFGIVGTVLISLFFFFYYRIAFLCNRLLRKNHINSLILALSAAVLLHATTDMTMLWSQTALFYALILSGLGADERDLEQLRYRYYHNNYRMSKRL